MPVKPSLDMTPFAQIQMKIYGGGLDAVMTQTVLDVCDGMSAVEHVHCPAVTKGVHGIDMLESLRRKSLLQILSADAVNAMPGEFFPPLTDK